MKKINLPKGIKDLEYLGHEVLPWVSNGEKRTRAFPILYEISTDTHCVVIGKVDGKIKKLEYNRFRDSINEALQKLENSSYLGNLERKL